MIRRRGWVLSWTVWAGDRAISEGSIQRRSKRACRLLFNAVTLLWIYTPNVTVITTRWSRP